MNDYRPNPPGNQETSQDELDRALDAMVRGDDRGVNRLDAGMQTTISHLYALADLSGSSSHSADIPATGEGVQRPLPRAVKPGSSDRERAPSRTPVLLRPTNANKRRSIFMSTLSGLAAALLIGLGIYAAIPVFSPDAPEPTTIAFQAIESTPEATAVATTLSDTTYNGSEPVPSGPTTFIPPQGTKLTGVIGSDERNPVSPDECVVAPQTQEDVLKVLGIAPADGDVAPVRSDDSSIEVATLGEIQSTFRQWQSCRRFGNTFGAMALETDQFIRNDIYGPQPILGSFYPITTAYSESTLSELLTARVTMDKQLAQLGEDKARHDSDTSTENGLNLNLWVIDTTNLPGDPTTGEYLAASEGTFVSLPVVWTNPDIGSDQPFPTAYVGFQLVDGQWKIASWFSADGPPPVGD